MGIENILLFLAGLLAGTYVNKWFDKKTNLKITFPIGQNEVCLEEVKEIQINFIKDVYPFSMYIYDVYGNIVYEDVYMDG